MFRTPLRLLFIALLLPVVAFAEGDPAKKFTRADYISTWKDEAIKQMQEHGVPASITLAQGILESGDGNSRLAREANNHFGIKCHDWQGQKIYHDDDARNECFRKYKTAKESFEDHSIFLKKTRYAFLFDYKITDYKSWSHGLKKAGYATNPKYPELLIRIIEENNLTVYDTGGKNYKPQKTQPEKSNRRGPEEIVINLNRGTEVYLSDNRIQYVITKRTETSESLGKQLSLGQWQVGKYNDLEKGETIPSGTKIYIQPKRNKAATAETHLVTEGETLRDVSQEYGVKMSRILKKSRLPKDYEVKPGDKLSLR